MFRVPLTVLALLTVLTASATDIKPSGKELQAEKAWLNEHLKAIKLQPAPPNPTRARLHLEEPGLDVLANHDPVIQNGRGGKPLRIGDQEYTRGLYCHALSQVDVHLPSPGKSFTAVVGLDHNDDTARGKGSVVFTVKVKDKVVFQSEVMRFGTLVRAVDVNLDGADSFTLEVGDAGDGIGWDQSDWADAKVKLVDGRELWLGEMPLRALRVEAPLALIERTTALPASFIYGGQSSDALLALWPRKTVAKKLDPSRDQYTCTWTEPGSGLEVRCIAGGIL